MDNNFGTPNTLRQAIQVSLCVGPLNEIDDRVYNVIKDYLSQHFCAAMLGNEAMENELKKLFDRIVTDEPPRV